TVFAAFTPTPRAACGPASSAAAARRSSRGGFSRDGCGRVVKEDKHVVLLVEASFLDLGIEDGRVRKVELLERQSGPAFIDVAAAVALVYADAQAFGIVNAAGDSGAKGCEVHTGLARDRFKRRFGAGGYKEVARPQPA